MESTTPFRFINSYAQNLNKQFDDLIISCVPNNTVKNKSTTSLVFDKIVLRESICYSWNA